MSVLINGKREAMTTAYELLEHFDEVGYIYPDMADGVTLTAGNVAWAYDGFATLIPENGINSDFAIHNVNVGNISANASFQLSLYYGPSDIYFNAIVFSRENPQNRSIYIPVQRFIVPINNRVRVKLASNTGSGETCVVKVQYHRCSY